MSHVQLNIHRKGDKLLSFHSMSALMPNIACKLFWMIVLKSAFRFFPGHICLYIWLFFCTLKVLNMSQWEWIISKLSYTAAYITSYEKSQIFLSKSAFLSLVFVSSREQHVKKQETERVGIFFSESNPWGGGGSSNNVEFMELISNDVENSVKKYWLPFLSYIFTSR